MKVLPLICGIALLIIAKCHAYVPCISIDYTGTNTVLFLDNEECNTIELSAKLDVFSNLNTNAQIFVFISPSAQAVDVVKVLHLIQKSGMHRVVLRAKGKEKGKDGSYWVSIDCSKYKIGGCQRGYYLNSGFHPWDEFELSNNKKSQQGRSTIPTGALR